MKSDNAFFPRMEDSSGMTMAMGLRASAAETASADPTRTATI